MRKTTSQHHPKLSTPEQETRATTHTDCVLPQQLSSYLGQLGWVLISAIALSQERGIGLFPQLQSLRKSEYYTHFDKAIDS